MVLDTLWFDMLAQGQTAEVERTISGYHQAFCQNSAQEKDFIDVMNYFGRDGNNSIKNTLLLDHWITQHPNSYVAHLAKAYYLITEGHLKRGGDIAANVRPEQWQGMQVSYREALRLTAKARELTPHSVHCYIPEIYAQMSLRGILEDDGETLYNKAIQMCPASYAMRDIRMAALRPHWGGSMEQMDKHLQESRQHLTLEQANTLEVRALIEKAHYFQHFLDDNDAALAYVAQALQVIPQDFNARIKRMEIFTTQDDVVKAVVECVQLLKECKPHQQDHFWRDAFNAVVLMCNKKYCPDEAKPLERLSEVLTKKYSLTSLKFSNWSAFKLAFIKMYLSQ